MNGNEKKKKKKKRSSLLLLLASFLLMAALPFCVARIPRMEVDLKSNIAAGSL